MTEFKPNPFKEWEDSIVNKIADEINIKFNVTAANQTTRYVITRYKEELEKQKGVKECH